MEVKEFVYSRSLFKNDWDVTEHVRGDFKSRMSMYETLVSRVIMYGVEGCKCKEYKDVEKLHIKCIRWTLRWEKCWLWYIVLKEMDREKMKIRAGNSAYKFEEKVLESDLRTIVKA